LPEKCGNQHHRGAGSKTEAEMLKTKNFGRKSLSEIKDILNEYDLTFGMDIDSKS